MISEDCFKGKKALVTGAGRGIGRALIAALHSREAIVYAVSKTQENLNSLKNEFPNVVPICVDLSNWDETRKALESLERMDILINNAGISVPELFHEVTPEQFDMHMNVNVKAAINVSQVLTKKMIDEEKPGAVVNISSICGAQAFAMSTSYCCSKAALQMLSKVMAIELGPHKITVNWINACHIDTDMFSGAIKTASERFGKTPEEIYDLSMKSMISRTPTKETLMPMEEVVTAILFFASGITSQITGSNLSVDGGFLIA